MKEVLLVGNPNTGKTTLFNSLTKSDEHVGNWHGVTVENKSKSFFVPNICIFIEQILSHYSNIQYSYKSINFGL